MSLRKKRYKGRKVAAEEGRKSAERKNKKSLKKGIKTVDKGRDIWYYIQAVCEKAAAEHIENRIEKQRKKKHTNNKVNFNGSQ